MGLNDRTLVGSALFGLILELSFDLIRYIVLYFLQKKSLLLATKVWSSARMAPISICRCITYRLIYINRWLIFYIFVVSLSTPIWWCRVWVVREGSQRLVHLKENDILNCLRLDITPFVIILCKCVYNIT